MVALKIHPVHAGAAANDRMLYPAYEAAQAAGLPVVVPEVAEAPSLGAAVLAAHGAGHFTSIDEGIAAMVRPGRRVEPIAANVACYNEIYGRYRALYPAMRTLREAAAP